MTDFIGCIDIFQNVTDSCTNNFTLATEQCKGLCVISIMSSLKMCSDLLFSAGQLSQFKDFMTKCCLVNLNYYCLEFNKNKYEYLKYYLSGH